jgi:hypothetical protein
LVEEIDTRKRGKLEDCSNRTREIAPFNASHKAPRNTCALRKLSRRHALFEARSPDFASKQRHCILGMARDDWWRYACHI